MRSSLTHIHRNSATDRTPALIRVAAAILSVLLLIPAALPTVAALSTEGNSHEVGAKSPFITVGTVDVHIPTNLPGEGSILTFADPEAMTAELLGMYSRDNLHDTLCGIPEEIPDDGVDPIDPTPEIPDSTPKEEDTPDGQIPAVDIFDPTLPLTQELIAQRIETRMNKQVRGGSRIYYPWPSGAMAVDLYKDGKQILKGQVADIGGTVYVPVQRFADQFGTFKTVYTEATEQVVITGINLSITVKVGDPYITVNERIFYTGKKVISLGGWIFVPLTSMCKALNATVTIRSGYYDAFITSGDTTKVKWASEFYDSTDLYWLSRIISAEAKGEPFAGQIAVGNVVLNRKRSSQFPNTVKGVIFDTKYGTQFSPVASGTIYQAPTASAVMAAKICLEGYSLSTQMIYFYNPKIATSSWIGRTRPYIMTIGNHKFYG